MSPKLNRISNRVPSSYPWKDSGKSGKDGMGSDTKNEKLESPCLWMARTSSIKRLKIFYYLIWGMKFYCKLNSYQIVFPSKFCYFTAPMSDITLKNISIQID